MSLQIVNPPFKFKKIDNLLVIGCENNDRETISRGSYKGRETIK